MDKISEEKMSLTDHLEELRKRLMRSLIAAFIAFGACYNFKEWLFDVLTRPLVQSLPKNTYMIYTSLPEAFFNYLKISFFAGLVVSSPYILFQLWKFISPGLYSSEKKYVFPFVLSSTILFAGGVLFGYFVALPPAFKFFLEFSTDFLKPMLTIREYLSLSIKLLLAFGIVFEIPVFIFFLAKIGVVNAGMLVKQRKYAILLIFITAAFLTPTPDAFTQTLMAIPMMILYEFGILVAKWGERKKAKKETEEAAEEGT